MVKMMEKSAGIPLPVATHNGTVAQLEAELRGFKFRGPGWYSEGEQMALVIPRDLDEVPEEGDRLYARYAWDEDPRQVIADLIQLPERTPVPLPEVVTRNWPQIVAAGAEIKAWADGQERAARDEAVAGIEASPIEDPDEGAMEDDPIEPIPMLQAEVPTGVMPDDFELHASGSRYHFGPYVVQVLTLEQAGVLPKPVPDFVRLLDDGDLTLAVFVET